ncbi:DUF4382 domain-containing protein [Christiangramia sabulilitoris]|uniref:DUF4382 domain-containing protein n=1 Tax=Christiangramia sabulilitoris TaxID=2583991 RepID=A0A550HWI5_9FLAO|nr:DUF4382 domain-containing protein [Christiangramia sabulilitoris]TRO62878.1 DUF4382 domain-containing protein [Christiangramia sabulilitoris]
MLIKNLTKLSLLLGLVLFISCSEDDSLENPGNGENSTAVYLTDAPVDQANVEAVFVTVSEVRVNGKAIEGFNKTTIQLSSLTKGRTELLGNLNLKSGTTSNISLVLADTDATGNGPGNYVVLNGGAKQKLSGATEINIKDQVEIVNDARNEIIIDFDLRKTVKQEGDNFSFVSKTQLENNLRTVNKLNAGAVKGKADNMSEANGEVVVAYAYKKGTFSNSESNANNDGINFANAVSSSVVTSSNGEFEIHFLEEGDYELHFASYSDNDQDGKLEFTGMVEASAISSLDLTGFRVESNSEVNIQVSFTGLLGL